MRTEQQYTQEKMAEILGLSKKTLIQIEKGRTEISWTVVIALCALFKESEILYHTLGGDPLEVIRLLSVETTSTERSLEKTMGGKVWWKELEKQDEYCLQQNIISQHYRIINEKNYRVFSSFNKEEVDRKLNELTS